MSIFLNSPSLSYQEGQRRSPALGIFDLGLWILSLLFLFLSCAKDKSITEDKAKDFPKHIIGTWLELVDPASEDYDKLIFDSGRKRITIFR